MIPVLRGRDWDKERATNLPKGTPVKIAEHDDGEWAAAVNAAVKDCETEFVIISHPAAWFERLPEASEFLADLAWDVDVTWGPLIVLHDGTPVGTACQAAFCPNRLTRENYINPVMCVRRSKFLEVGGVTSGLWDLQIRILAAGGRFKYVPEAFTARDEDWVDPSPAPEPAEVKASFYHQATPGTTYWRCQLPARWLPGQAVFNHPFVEPDGENKPRFVNHVGTAVFQYAGDVAHHEMTRMLQAQGHRVLIEADDDYTNWFKDVMPRAGWFRTISDSAETGGYSVEQHRLTCQIADGIIVTTDRLANRYRKLNPNVFVCPNQIDPVDWPKVEKPDDGIFRIGWFASASHRDDGKLIRRALEWAASQPDVEVNLIGIGVTNDKPWYPFDFKYRPWSNDLGVYRRFLLDLDVGLAPVTGNPWALGRSDLKALEYAMAGAVPIVSDVDPYKGCEVPGIIHCPDAKAFLKSVQWCVANRDEIKDLAKEAREYVLDERTVEANIHLWSEACST